MDIGNLHIEHIHRAFGCDGDDGIQKTLAVKSPPVSAQALGQFLRFFDVRKPDTLGKYAQVVAIDDQFVLGADGIIALAAAPVRELSAACPAAIPIEGADDAQTL